jgi:hypothetical protein
MLKNVKPQMTIEQVPNEYGIIQNHIHKTVRS